MRAGRLQTPTEPSEVLHISRRAHASRWAIVLLILSLLAVSVAVGLLAAGGFG